MSGTINTLQKCPSCSKRFRPSKGDFPIVCAECKTQPTKFIIKLYWQQKRITISRDRSGQTVHSWHHAVNLLGNIRTEIQGGTFDPEIYKSQSATSFSAFWDRFKSKYEKSISTYAKIHTIGKHHLVPFMALQMRDIRAYHVDEWWEKLKDKSLSPHYMNDIHQWLKRFMTEAMELDIIEKVPRFPKPIEKGEKEIQWLSGSEQDDVIENIPSYDQNIFEFMFLTGVRVGEAIGLQRADVDLKRHRTIIQHTVKRDRRTIGETKNKKPRVIPHAPEIEDCLKRSMKASGPHKFVFINKWGRHYTADYMRSVFNNACLDAEIKPIPLKNATRHSFGMRLISQGVDIWKTSKALGHSDIKMTENYVSMLADELMDVYKKSSSKNVVRMKVGDT